MIEALQELQLVALAQVVDEFLVNKRESEKGQKDQDAPTNNNQEGNWDESLFRTSQFFG